MKKATLISAIILAVCTATAQWEWKNPLPQGNPLNDIIFLNENDGWAVGEFGSILCTHDGGTTWESQESGSTGVLRSISFIDTENGWIAGHASATWYGGEHPGFILHTSDGGATWEELFVIDDYCLVDVFFTDDSNGWALGNMWPTGHGHIILHTNDGGTSVASL